MIPRNNDGVCGIVDYSGRLLTNSNVQHEIALGNVYRFAYRVASLAAGASAYVLWDSSLNGTRIGTGTYKAKFDLTSTARPLTIESYEGATVSAPGTVITCFNFNRCDGCDASLNGLYHTPTVDASGNKYAPDGYLFASSTSQGQLTVTSPGQSGEEFSAHWHPLKKYLFKITNIGDAVTNVVLSGRIIDESKFRFGGK